MITWGCLKHWLRDLLRGKSGTLTCQEVVNLLAEYLDGALDVQTARELERHLEGCVACHNFIKTYRATAAWVKEITYEEIPDEFKDRLASFLKAKIRQEKAGDN
jgi:anti-sigma factor RsiW